MLFSRFWRDISPFTPTPPFLHSITSLDNIVGGDDQPIGSNMYVGFQYVYSIYTTCIFDASGKKFNCFPCAR